MDSRRQRNMPVFLYMYPMLFFHSYRNGGRYVAIWSYRIVAIQPFLNMI